MLPIVLISSVWWWGSGCSSNPIETAALPPVAVDFWPYLPPRIDGGEVVRGQLSQLTVSPTPPQANVQLYLSSIGEGSGPCDVYPSGLCAKIQQPERFAQVTANDEGVATFSIDGDRFDRLGNIGWQAVVLDPELEGVAATTEAIVRHVSVSPDEAAVIFEGVTGRSGLVNTFTSGNTHSGGMAFVDLNNDHWPDLYISNGSGLSNYLYRNNGDGSFTELSFAVRKPTPNVECAGVKAADIDNDGDLDLMVPGDNGLPMVTSTPQPYEGGPNLLFVNEGDFEFREGPAQQAKVAGFADLRGWRNSSVAVADYDLDGCIDAYVTHWAMATLPAGDNTDRLLRGNCDGTFTDVTAETGVDGKGRDGLVGFWWDADFDRYPELYVGNNSDLDIPPDFEPRDVIYDNEGGVLIERELVDVGNDAWAAMGVDVGDIDGDGDWDMYITDVWELPPVPRGNVLYLGEPDGSLSPNACQAFGLCFGHNSWPVNFEDFNNDGWIDLWVGSSFPSTAEMVFINTERPDGTGRTFVSHRQAPWSGHISRAGTTADYDGDGDVDVVLFDEGAASSLWMSHLMDEESDDQHWIELKLVGQRSNRAAIGALLRLEADGLPLMRRVTGGDSAHSHRSLIVHFGLGTDTLVDELEITWPIADDSLAVQRITNLAADRFYIIDELDGVLEHALMSPEAEWVDGTLIVTTASNYGGRAQIDVEGYGPLVYDAEDISYKANFDAAEMPVEVTLTADLGGGATVPVVMR